MSSFLIPIIAAAVFVVIVIPVIVASFLRNVEAGTIRMVSWLQGGTVIYRGPGKSKEIPLLTTGTTISSKVINVDLDITDQTADIDDTGTPRPIIDKLNAALRVALADPKVKKLYADSGMDQYPPDQETPEAAAALLKREIKRWGDVVRSNHIFAK